MQQEFIIEMLGVYPFASITEAVPQWTTVYVRKSLHFSGEEEKTMIKRIVHFLKVAKHPNLINLQSVREGEAIIELCYEYVPLKMEKWLFEVDQDLVNTLEEQLLALAQHLSSRSIKFTFNPSNIGVSQNMTIKYFLDQFSVDTNNAEENLHTLQKDIQGYFDEIKKELLDTSVMRKSRHESISTDASYKHKQAEKEQKSSSKASSSSNNTQKLSKSAILAQKIQSSKKRCQQLLNRLKNSKKQ